MPLLDLFWTFLWFFLFVAWLMILFQVIGDVFRSRDLGGFAKAMWLLFIVFLPGLGVLIYLIARGNDMTQHAISDAQERDAAMKAYVREAAGSGSAGTASEIAQLAELRDKGVLTPEEFDQGTARILAG